MQSSKQYWTVPFRHTIIMSRSYLTSKYLTVCLCSQMRTGCNYEYRKRKKKLYGRIQALKKGVCYITPNGCPDLKNVFVGIIVNVAPCCLVPDVPLSEWSEAAWGWIRRLMDDASGNRYMILNIIILCYFTSRGWCRGCMKDKRWCVHVIKCFHVQ